MFCLNVHDIDLQASVHSISQFVYRLFDANTRHACFSSSILFISEILFLLINNCMFHLIMNNVFIIGLIRHTKNEHSKYRIKFEEFRTLYFNTMFIWLSILPCV